MRLDIPRGLITGRVTGNTGIIRVLVDAHIVKAQVRGHVFADRLVLGREVVRHAQVHDHGHGLERDHALANVAVGADGAPVQCPSFVSANEPGHVALCAGRVLEGVGLIFAAVVPAGVEVGQAGHGLLVDAATVGVDLGHTGIVDSSKV